MEFEINPPFEMCAAGSDKPMFGPVLCVQIFPRHPDPFPTVDRSNFRADDATKADHKFDWRQTDEMRNFYHKQSAHWIPLDAVDPSRS